MTVMNLLNVPEYDSRQGASPPSGIVVKTQSRELELTYDLADGGQEIFHLPFEFLRVYSPSAEVVGHGPGQEILQVGKRSVGLDGLEPVGQYAVKPLFSDGHSSGLYSWGYLRWLVSHQTALWQNYLARLEAAGESRDAGPKSGSTAAGSGCPSVKVEQL